MTMAGKVAVRLTVNGVATDREVEPRMLLADFLRHELGLTGTHVGCEHGVCGACTVMVDGATARSCLLFASQLDGATITTIEGLTKDGSARELEAPTEGQVRVALSGNLCRCTGYLNIIDAVLAAGEQMGRRS